jgi:hypothetical protein
MIYHTIKSVNYGSKKFSSTGPRLERFDTDKRSGSYPRVEHPKSVHSVRPLALPTKIRLGWKGMPGTNALVYYEHSQIAASRSFIGLAPGPRILGSLNVGIVAEEHLPDP